MTTTQWTDGIGCNSASVGWWRHFANVNTNSTHCSLMQGYEKHVYVLRQAKHFDKVEKYKWRTLHRYTCKVSSLVGGSWHNVPHRVKSKFLVYGGLWRAIARLENFFSLEFPSPNPHLTSYESTPNMLETRIKCTCRLQGLETRSSQFFDQRFQGRFNCYPGGPIPQLPANFFTLVLQMVHGRRITSLSLHMT